MPSFSSRMSEEYRHFKSVKWISSKCFSYILKCLLSTFVVQPLKMFYFIGEDKCFIALILTNTLEITLKNS